MEYEPGDPKKVVHTTIALNVLANVILAAIHQHRPELRDELIIGLAHAIRKMPREMSGVADLLADWKQLLEQPPT